MRKFRDGSETVYKGEGEHEGLTAVVSRKDGGYAVHAMWRDASGTSWIGGYGEGNPITLEEANNLATKFVTGVPVPGELGGYADNGPPAQANVEDEYARRQS